MSARHHSTPQPSIPERAKPTLPDRRTGPWSLLERYKSQIERYAMLEPEEEQELARRVREHDDADAAYRLITSHLRLAFKIAMEFHRHGAASVLDVLQEGNAGLVVAARKFDPDRSVRFSYYAAYWIRAYILKHLMDNHRLVKLGTTQTQRKLYFHLPRERRILEAQGLEADTQTLARRLKAAPAAVEEMSMRMEHRDMSLNQPLGEEDGDAHINLLPDPGQGVEEEVMARETREVIQERLRELLPTLNQRETSLLNRRLFTDDPATLRELGEGFGVSRERMRQVEQRLLDKLRESMTRQEADALHHLA